MKVIRGNQLERYNPAGHYDMLAQRIHSPQISESQQLTLGLSWFLPGGGTESSVVSPGWELIYYIVEGEMTVEANDEQFVLQKGDSIFLKVGDSRSSRNESSLPAAMLVVSAKM